jgi:hypothetical protein
MFKIEVDCFDQTIYHAAYALLGVGFTSRGENTKQCQFVIDESRYKVQDNYKIAVTSLDQNPYVPNQSYYISDLERLIEDGYVSVYLITSDGFEPLHVTLKDVCNEHDIKVMEYVENNFFHLFPFIN